MLISDRETLLWLLTRCFLGCKGAASVGPVLCQQWLLELMGHAKALATGMTAVPEGCQLAQVTHLSQLCCHCKGKQMTAFNPFNGVLYQVFFVFLVLRIILGYGRSMMIIT